MTRAAAAARCFQRHRLVLPGVIGLAWAALCFCTGPGGDFPLNDDWTYAAAVQSILTAGRFSLPATTTANVFAQAYWGALFCLPFGFSYEALRLSTFVMGEVGLMATYALLRQAYASAGVAALGVAAVGCNPLYLSQSLTFMTDVPFAALSTLSLAMFVRGSRREDRPAIAGAYGVALLALLIRQFAIVLPIAFAVAEWRRGRLARGGIAALAVLLFAGIHLGFQRWMVATGRSAGFDIRVATLTAVDLGTLAARFRSNLLPAAGFIGFCMLPLAATVPGALWRGGLARPWSIAVATGAALLLIALNQQRIIPLLGNVLMPFGIGPLALTDTYLSEINLPALPFQAAFWRLLSIGACWGAAMTAAACVAAASAADRGWTALLLGFAAAYAAAVLIVGMIAPVFDRYFITVLPALAALLVRGRRWGRRELAFGAALVAAMATFSVAATHDWLAWNRARWAAVALLEARSIPATQIDGGYEFNGTTTYQPGPTSPWGKPGWWVMDDRYTIAAGPLAGKRELARFAVPSWLWQASIYVLERKP